MTKTTTSSICIGVVICGIVTSFMLLGLSIFYWSIPITKPIIHHFAKVSAERFSSGLELQEADPRVGSGISATHSHVLLTWQSPLCAEPAIHSNQDSTLSRFHIQYWSDMSWNDFLRSFGSYDVNDGDAWSILPGNIYTDDCFVVLENASTSRQISFRVRSHVNHAIYQFFKPHWSVWSDVVLLPPATKELSLCEDARGSYSSLNNSSLWCITIACIGLVIYSRWNSPQDSMRKAKRRIRSLEEEVINLKQELDDAENENKMLMRLKGYGLETLSWKQLHDLEHELHMGLEIIETHKEDLHPLLDDYRSSVDSISSISPRSI